MSSNPVAHHPSVLRHWLPYAIIGALAIAIYSNTLFHQYALDDAILITGNSYTTQGFEGIKDIMTKDAFTGAFGEDGIAIAGGRYRPLSMVTFALEAEIFGLNPFISHLVNVLLFSFTCLLLYHILQSLLKPLHTSGKWWFEISFIAVMLFTAHPIHVEVVANIKGRDEIMGLLMSLLTLYSALRYTQTHHTKHLAATGLWFLGALLSKENAITFLAIVPLTLYFFTQSRPKAWLTPLGPMILSAVVFLAARATFTSTNLDFEGNEILNNPFLFATKTERYATTILTWLLYFKLLVFPHPLTHDYYWNQIPYTTFADWRVLLSLFIHGALAYLALKGFRSKTLSSYAILFYFITFSIVSNLFFTVGILMNERFLYLSSVGACLLAGNALYLLASRFPKWQIATIAVTSIFMIGFSLKTMSRNADWYDNYTLFSADAITSDKSAKVKAALAGQLIKLAGEAENKDEEQKLRNEAIELLHASLKIYPKYHVALNMLGDQYLLIDQSDTAQIAPYYRSVIANRMGGQKEASRNLALLYLANGYYEKSVEFYRLARKRDPKNLYLLNRMAEAYLGLGMHDSSIAILKGALEINREYGETYFTLGKVNYDLDKSSDEAISWLEQGLKVDPDNQNIRTLLIQLYAYRGEDDKLRKLESDSGSDTNDEYAIALAKGKAAYAKNDFTAAIKAFKIYYEKYQNTDQVNKNTVFLAMYGKSLMETGDIPGAKAMMELAYANQPDHDFVLRSLGNIAFHYEKNYPKAEKYFEDCVAVNTKEPFTDYTNLGSVCLIQGKKDKALAAYEKAMEYGRSRSVVGNLYLLYKEKGNTEKAAYYNNLLKDPALQ